jgi:hypothetical protein
LTILKIDLKNVQLEKQKKRRSSATNNIQQTVTGFFSFWKIGKTEKDDSEKNLTLEIVSNLDQNEILKELSRCCKILKMELKQTNDTTLRCIFNDLPKEENEDVKPVTFDVCMITVKNTGFILKFSQVKGDSAYCKVVFEFMKKELKLTKQNEN